MCRDEFGKAEVHLELNMTRDVKGNRKGFYRYIGSKRNTKENAGLLLDGGGNLFTNKKAEVLNVILSFVFFIYKICPTEHQPPYTSRRVWRNKDLVFLKED